MRAPTLIAGVLILVGLVWIGQGTGIIRGSGFMTDDIKWAVVGAILLAVGVVVAVSAVRNRPKA
jgi:hypothetical protein